MTAPDGIAGGPDGSPREVHRISVVLYSDGSAAVEGIPTGPMSAVVARGLLCLALDLVADHERRTPGRLVTPDIVVPRVGPARSS
jgi:hypothetical protein